ncbi:hypothetical protein OF83DRAFT_451409 [Amylostereum chailletii]|nr:hypothetical protein OF83DRAFT_451409 [Amylostereum chailletii]
MNRRTIRPSMTRLSLFYRSTWTGLLSLRARGTNSPTSGTSIPHSEDEQLSQCCIDTRQPGEVMFESGFQGSSTCDCRSFDVKLLNHRELPQLCSCFRCLGAADRRKQGAGVLLYRGLRVFLQSCSEMKSWHDDPHFVLIHPRMYRLSRASLKMLKILEHHLFKTVIIYPALVPRSCQLPYSTSSSFFDVSKTITPKRLQSEPSSTILASFPPFTAAGSCLTLIGCTVIVLFPSIRTGSACMPCSSTAEKIFAPTLASSYPILLEAWRWL